MKCQCSSNRRLVASVTAETYDDHVPTWIQHFNFLPAKWGFGGSQKYNSPIYLIFSYSRASVTVVHIGILKQLKKKQNKTKKRKNHKIKKTLQFADEAAFRGMFSACRRRSLRCCQVRDEVVNYPMGAGSRWSELMGGSR